MLQDRAWRWLLGPVSILFLGVFFLCSGALADSHVRIVRLSYVEGTVQIDRGNGHGLERAFLNMPISESARLVTGSDGKAEVQFEDGSNIRLVPDTAIGFARLGLRSNGDKITTVDLEQGTAYINFHKHDNEFTLAVAGRQVQLQRSSSLRAEVSDGELRLAVLNGEVSVSGGPEVATVKKNETLSANVGSGFTVAQNISSAPFDDWNASRDEYIQQYASADGIGYDSPYSYGSSDLNYYGSFYNSPWGVVWRPYYTSALWDPYADGAWVLYPGYGWTWVSAYPWGWLPYHYGSWVFWPGYGWCWQPGVWNRWAPVTPVIDPPGGFHAPTPPTNGGGVGIVSVGHGPSVGPTGPRGRRVLGGGGGIGLPVRSVGGDGNSLGGTQTGIGAHGIGGSGNLGNGEHGTEGGGMAASPRIVPILRPSPGTEGSGKAASPRIVPIPRPSPGRIGIEPAPRTGPTASHPEPHFAPPPRSFSAPSFHSSPPAAHTSRPH